MSQNVQIKRWHRARELMSNSPQPRSLSTPPSATQDRCFRHSTHQFISDLRQIISPRHGNKHQNGATRIAEFN